MPTYDYECQACDHRFEKFQSIMANPLKKCPECKKMSLQRLIGTGAGVIFKGSGFYQRPKAQLDRLEGRLETWAEEGEFQSTLGQIRESVLSVCAGDEPGSDSRQTCEAFLDAA